MAASCWAGDHETVRLNQGLDDLVGERCTCRACETSAADGWERERYGYYVGIAVGLRLARAVDGPLTGGGQ